jgi:hypothetical protein
MNIYRSSAPHPPQKKKNLMTYMHNKYYIYISQVNFPDYTLQIMNSHFSSSTE